jgi:hypothetical protein
VLLSLSNGAVEEQVQRSSGDYKSEFFGQPFLAAFPFHHHAHGSIQLIRIHA